MRPLGYTGGSAWRCGVAHGTACFCTPAWPLVTEVATLSSLPSWPKCTDMTTMFSLPTWSLCRGHTLLRLARHWHMCKGHLITLSPLMLPSGLFCPPPTGLMLPRVHGGWWHWRLSSVMLTWQVWQGSCYPSSGTRGINKVGRPWL